VGLGTNSPRKKGSERAGDVSPYFEKDEEMDGRHRSRCCEKVRGKRRGAGDRQSDLIPGRRGHSRSTTTGFLAAEYSCKAGSR